MKSFLTLLALTLIFVCTGIVLDVQGVEISGICGLWVSIALVLVFLMLVLSAFIRHTLHGVSFAITSAVISAMLAILAFTDTGMSVLWPMIPLSVFAGIAFSGLIVYRDGFTSIVGVGGFPVSVGLIIGTTWSYLAGGLLVAVALLSAITVRLLKREKKYEIPRISIVERAKKIKEDCDE